MAHKEMFTLEFLGVRFEALALDMAKHISEISC
jgi:hypothetical protein